MRGKAPGRAKRSRGARSGAGARRASNRCIVIYDHEQAVSGTNATCHYLERAVELGCD